jgi:tripartite ATP-independent transporter DctM subunit
MASSYALVLGMVVYRDVSWRDLLDVMAKTIEFTAIVLFIISIAGLYGWLLVRLQIPLVLAETVVEFTANPKLLMLLLAFFFLVIGCFMSVAEAVLIFTPIMVPMAKALYIDPLYFGIVMVICLSVGVITPPFGNVLYVLVGITGETFEQVVRAHLPFLIPIAAAICLLIFFPGLVTFLPQFLSG